MLITLRFSGENFKSFWKNLSLYLLLCIKKSFTEKNNSGKWPSKDSHNPFLVTIYVFCITAHPPMKRTSFFLKKWSSIYLHTVLKFAFYTFIKNKRGLPGAARDYFTISLWNSPVQIDLRTQQALGWGEPPTIKIFIHKPTPRSNFCLLAPAQFSKHKPPFGRLPDIHTYIHTFIFI